MTMTHEELEDRLDDIVSMGERRARAHIKALFLDLIGDDEPYDGKLIGGTPPLKADSGALIRNNLRRVLRQKVGDV